jgi:Holliday junction resolvase RusA-like endonuclease
VSVVIEVHGIPAPQGSKVRNRYGAIYESGKTVAPWREAIRAEVQRQVTVPLAGAVRCWITFRLPRPRGHYGTGRNGGTIRHSAPVYPAGRPDLDKLARAVLDGLTDGGAWKDDGQVVMLLAQKVYALPGMPAGCRIELHVTDASADAISGDDDDHV